MRAKCLYEHISQAHPIERHCENTASRRRWLQQQHQWLVQSNALQSAMSYDLIMSVSYSKFIYTALLHRIHRPRMGTWKTWSVTSNALWSSSASQSTLCAPFIAQHTETLDRITHLSGARHYETNTLSLCVCLAIWGAQRSFHTTNFTRQPLHFVVFINININITSFIFLKRFPFSALFSSL